MFFNVCDLGLDPMTFILKLDLNMVTYLPVNNEVNRSKGSKIISGFTDPLMDRHTDRRVKNLYLQAFGGGKEEQQQQKTQAAI